MFTKTKIALSVALMLGGASAALAGNDGYSQAEGGFHILGSNGARVGGWQPALQSYAGNGGNTYGLVASPSRKHPRANAPKSDE
jgi:hypothetical protein